MCNLDVIIITSLINLDLGIPVAESLSEQSAERGVDEICDNDYCDIHILCIYDPE